MAIDSEGCAYTLYLCEAELDIGQWEAIPAVVLRHAHQNLLQRGHCAVTGGGSVQSRQLFLSRVGFVKLETERFLPINAEP